MSEPTVLFLVGIYLFLGYQFSQDMRKWHDARYEPFTPEEALCMLIIGMIVWPGTWLVCMLVSRLSEERSDNGTK